jgi:hypothetical protein
VRLVIWGDHAFRGRPATAFGDPVNIGALPGNNEAADASLPKASSEWHDGLRVLG